MPHLAKNREGYSDEEQKPLLYFAANVMVMIINLSILFVFLYLKVPTLDSI